MQPAASARAPNLIVVMTDDQTVRSFTPQVMPFTWRLFHDGRSGNFENALAVPPLCCPARAGILTGQYPHNHGVVANVPGYPLLREKRNVLPEWLRRAGYRTAMVGKYLNYYGFDRDLHPLPTDAEPAPGWDSWFAAYGEPGYYDHAVSDDGEVIDYGRDREDYSTDVFTERAIEEVSRAGRGEPLFMWLSYDAPHLDASTVPPCEGKLATPPTGEAFRRFAGSVLPKDPSFDEADRSDKLRGVADRDALTKGRVRQIKLRWRCGLASLRAVDDGVRELVAALRKAGELERTVLAFASDNGFFYGEHAIRDDKRLPYRAAARVPMAIRVGRQVAPTPPPEEIGALAGTFDLAPTLLDYAGAEPCLGSGGCRTIDARSLRPLLEGGPEALPADRAILLELREAYDYEALRTRRYLYMRLNADRAGPIPNGPGIELYDLEEDPFELDNLAALDPAGTAGLRAELDERLDRLMECAGEDCE